MRVISVDNDTEINRLAEFQPKEEPPPRIDRLQLAQTGCTATLDVEGVIHILNPDGQQIYAVKSDHVPFQTEPLLVTLNLWFMAFNNGRVSMQNEVKAKVLDLLKICL
jgi:hypothetical protein